MNFSRYFFVLTSLIFTLSFFTSLEAHSLDMSPNENMHKRFMKYASPLVEDPFFAAFPQTETFKLSTGEEVPVPFYVRGVKGLVMIGLVDLAETNKILAKHNVEAYAVKDFKGHPILNDQYLLMSQFAQMSPDIDPTTLDSKALIWISGSDFEHSSSGSIKPAALTFLIKDKRPCQQEPCLNLPAVFYLKYYTNTRLAYTAGRELWGLPKKMAQVGTDFESNAYKAFAVSNYRGTKEYFRMIFDSAKEGRLVIATPETTVPYVTVTPISNIGPGQTYNSFIVKSESLIAPFDPHSTSDQFTFAPDSEWGEVFKATHFQPFFWTYYPKFNGVWIRSAK